VNRRIAEPVAEDRFARFLANRAALVRAAVADLGFDLVERGDALEGLGGDRAEPATARSTTRRLVCAWQNARPTAARPTAPLRKSTVFDDSRPCGIRRADA
jgi:hypothetical protein